VRLFVRLQTAPIEVKKVARFVDNFSENHRWFICLYSQTSVYYICSGCQSVYEQPLGRIAEKINDRSGNATVLFKAHVGPPVPEKCPECGSPLHVAGPMWNGQIHDPQFVGRILEHLEGNEDKYGTSTRMRGMLTVAKEVGGTLSPIFFFMT
jgi:tRNA (guanine26-N2/guanine27-N2)-dimethyltransferase